MTDFFEIFVLTILGIVAFGVIAILGLWLLLLIWPIVVLALPIALIIYVFNLCLIAKSQKKTKRSR